MNDRNWKFIDLFAGAGGLSEGFVAQGAFVPVAHVEMNNYASDTLKTRACYYYLKENNGKNIYRRYLKGLITRQELYESVPSGLLDTIINCEISSKNIKDIFATIDNIMNEHGFENIDLIIGGPPCQAYSLMGRAVDSNGMRNDPRNFLYIEYIKFLKHYKPKAFVFENVPGILTADNGERIKKIIKSFKYAGYVVEYKILNARDYGVLQDRKRVIIFGWRKDLKLYYPSPHKVNYNVTVSELLRDLSPLIPGEENNVYVRHISNYLRQTELRKPHDILTQHMCRVHNENDLNIYYHVIDAWNNNHTRLKYYDLPVELRTRDNQESFVDRYKVVAGDLEYSHTMIAHIAKDGHYFIHPDIDQCRSISVREAARIQSFPDDFFFEGPRTAKYTQIGNAVPPLMAKAIAEEIANMI